MRFLSDDALERLRARGEPPDLTGTRYELLRELGRGGMGTVYLAHDRELEREVALKVVHAERASEDALQRLQREARILARLEHPGIVPVHDVGVLPDGRTFYVMKHVPGLRLDEHVRREPPLQERLRVFGRICEAVASAHAQGIVHRDLKPENVAIGEFGEVLVLDWGIARRIDRETSAPASQTDASEGASNGTREERATHATAEGTIIGTPGYMAPEQARGEIQDLDPRADVYALGALLRYLLTSEEPPRELALRRDTTAARWTPGIPRPLEAIARKAQSFERDERYASVSELMDELARYQDQLPVRALPENWLTRLGRVARKYRTPILLVLAYLAMRIVLFFFHGS